MKTLEGLYCDAVSVKPQDFDFGEGFTERWDIIYPAVDSWNKKKCYQYLDNCGYDYDRNESLDDLREKVKDEMFSNEHFAPMMNYIYPLPDFRLDPGDAQERIEDTNCVIVLIAEDGKCPDVPYMALSGGGMDLSWDICEAYMLLGYLPPVHFCNLPNFAGKKLDETSKWVVDGCKKSCELAELWAAQTSKNLDDLEKTMKNN